MLILPFAKAPIAWLCTRAFKVDDNPFKPTTTKCLDHGTCDSEGSLELHPLVQTQPAHCAGNLNLQHCPDQLLQQNFSSWPNFNKRREAVV